MRKSFILAVLFFVMAFLSACTMTGDITPPPGSEQQPVQPTSQTVGASAVYPIVSPDLAKGASIYKEECSQCHGPKGLGDGPQSGQLSIPVASLGLTDFSRMYSPAQWYTVVTEGSENRFMPAFSNLTDRQRWDVVAYAMSLGTSSETIAEGSQLFQQNCASCHGTTGEGDGPQATKLETPLNDLTAQSFMAQNSASSLYEAVSSGIQPEMPAFSTTLNENERWAVVAYLRDLSYTNSQTTTGAYPPPTSGVAAMPTATSARTQQAYPDPEVTQSPSVTSTAQLTSTESFIGNITVQLTNGSGGDAPSDAPVTLYGFDDMQNTYTATLTTGVDGLYTFNNVYMPAGRVFLAGAEYASSTYGSDIVTVDPTIPNQNLQITVYESTTDSSILTTDRVHIFFDFTDPQNVQVIEVFIISNPSNKAVVAPAPEGTVVTFPLPEGYSNLQFQGGALGDRYMEVAQGFADKNAVPPGVGSYQVIFAFQMPYSRKLDFSQAMYLPTSAAVVLLPDNGVKLVSKQLQDSGLSDFQGTSYHMYEASSLIAGSAIEFSLSGSPKKAGTTLFSQGTTQSLAIGLGAFGLVLIAVGLWLYRNNRLKLAAQGLAAGEGLSLAGTSTDALPEDEDTLMDAIITLDDQYHEGNLPEEAYLERRAVLKEKLRQVNKG